MLYSPWVSIPAVVLVASSVIADQNKAPSPDAITQDMAEAFLQEAAVYREVDGIRVPPFGCTMQFTRPGVFAWFEGYWGGNLARWPGPPAEPLEIMPLHYGDWTGGPYRNNSGEAWVHRINAWFREGVAAGLTQDCFRSFDDGHSSLRESAFPQLRVLSPVPSLGTPYDTVFKPRVTMGVQSYGMKGNSVIDASARHMLRAFYRDGGEPPGYQKAYRHFYENNVVYVVPAVRTYEKGADRFTFLSPFYLHSVGASGSDSKLLKPIVFASAALPPDLKTRILRRGMLAPTLMTLFRAAMFGDPRSPDAHRPALALPDEAADGFEGPTPVLDGLIGAAHNLSHVPPICRLRIEDMEVQVEGNPASGDRIYYENNTYGFTAALKRGQTLVLTVDLRFSWTDHALEIAEYAIVPVSGTANVEELNGEGSRLRIAIPWRPTNNKTDLRTDIAFLISDGAYFSAPAYISVRHIHHLDPITLGLEVR